MRGRPLLLVLALLTPALLLAHGALRSSEPGRDAHLLAAPRVLRLTFSERIELAVSRLVLLRNGVDTIALSAPRLEQEDRVLTADVVGTSGVGRYEIKWNTAGRDGHPVRGTIPFEVVGSTTDSSRAAKVTSDSVSRGHDTRGMAHGGAIAGAGGAGLTVDTAHALNHAAENNAIAGGMFASSGALQSGTRFLTFVAVLLVIGALSISMFLMPALQRQGRGSIALHQQPRVANIGLIASIVLLSLDVARLFMQVKSLDAGGSSTQVVSVLQSTIWGQAWVAHAVGALLTIAGFALLKQSRLLGLVTTLVGALSIATGSALSGHAAGVAHPLLPVLADATHVLAGGVWIGALLVITTAILPRLRGDAASSLVLLRAFSPFAIASALLIVISGAYAAWTHLGEINALTTTNYGRVLLAKLALFLFVFVLGARNRSATTRVASITRDTLALERSARVELFIAIALVAVTAVLVATPTPVR